MTAGERLIIQDHVRVGVELLQSLPETRELAAVVAEHHERFHGLGYPARKCGTDTLIEARIIAVADAWTAMLADRPYRAALPLELARDQLLLGAGTQFDPVIVTAMLDLVGDGPLNHPLRALAATA